MDVGYDGAHVMLWLRGELDALSGPLFAGALDAIANQGALVVAIDLSRLRFCNIGGLRAMAELAARLNGVGGRVEIIAPPLLTRMLELSDLRLLFVVHDLDQPDPTAITGDDQRVVNRAPRAASRPRTGSRHRLSSGT